VSGTPGYSLCLQNNGNNGYLELDFGNQTTTLVAFGLKMVPGGSYPGQPFIVALGDTVYNAAGTNITTPVQQVSVLFGLDGSVSAYRGGPINAQAGGTYPTDTLLAQAFNVFNPNAWNFVEISTTTNGTTGALSVRVNSKAVSGLTLTGINTQVTPNAYTNCVYWYCPYGSGYYSPQIDDLLLMDGTTGSGPNAFNSFQGELEVRTFAPISNGGTVQWTPISGSNYQNVDGPINNQGTIYNSSTTTGNIDIFNMATLSGEIINVLAVQVTGSYERTGTDMHSIGQRIVSSGTVSAGGTYALVQGQYQYFSDEYPNDPATSTTWTLSGVNAILAGYSLVS
jgi:hypothetical protein